MFKRGVRFERNYDDSCWRERLGGVVKASPFKLSKVGDPEQTLLDWQKYVKSFNQFLAVTKADGTHTEHVDCRGCKVTKDILLMIGQDELETLWVHVGRVDEEDSFKVVLRKVEDGITGQTNQAVSRHKLFTKMG